MEQQKNALELLDLMIQPGFCVQDGIIQKANLPAQGMLLCPGTPVSQLIAVGHEEYQNFSEGCLYLTLTVSGILLDASVTRVGCFDIFLMEQDADHRELQAMALAARELRKPLASIMTTASQLFPMEALSDDPVLREQVTRMNRGLYQMLRVIGNMSDTSRYISSRPQKEVLDICAFLKELFEKAQDLVAHAGLSLRYESLSQSIVTLADREKLERAVLNIISNAVKFTPAGGTVDARLTRTGNRLYLSIQDSGSGIPDGIRGTIHNRYLRHPGLEDSRFGIGLGMVLIRSTAASHGGTVLIDHPDGAGTRVTMTMEIRNDTSGNLRSPQLRIDYAGEQDHGLIELSDVLPADLYLTDK